MPRCFVIAPVVMLAACGGSDMTPVDGAGPDAPAPTRIATGRRLIDHAAVVGGITSDGYVVFSDIDPAGHSVAKVMSIDGGPAIALGGSGTASRFVFIDAVRDAKLSTGWVYGMTARALAPGAPPTELTRGAENFALDRSHGRGVISFGGTDEVAGLWVVALQ